MRLARRGSEQFLDKDGRVVCYSSNILFPATNGLYVKNIYKLICLLSLMLISKLKPNLEFGKFVQILKFWQICATIIILEKCRQFLRFRHIFADFAIWLHFYKFRNAGIYALCFQKAFSFNSIYETFHVCYRPP